MASIAATMTTDLAAPDSHKGSRVAVGAAPGQNVAIGSLDNGKDVTGTLVGHVDISEAAIVRLGFGFICSKLPGELTKKTQGTGKASITEKAEKGPKYLD